MAGENGATWVGAKFYTKGRESTVQLIVLHWMDTSMAGADATFTGGVREASAHFGLEDGKRHQYVHKADTAWHANDHVINHKSLGVEHSAQPGRPASEATVLDSIALCTDLCREFGLTADAIHQHSEYSATQCPGTLPVARIREAVRANLTTPQEVDMTPAEFIQLMSEAADRSTPAGRQLGTYLATATGGAAANAALAKLTPDAVANAVVAKMPAGSVDVAALAKAVRDEFTTRPLA